jgi:hypothetical protein
MDKFRFDHIVPGQNPDAMYKFYEIYYPWPWPLHRIQLIEAGLVLDTGSKEFKDSMERWSNVLSKIITTR